MTTRDPTYHVLARPRVVEVADAEGAPERRDDVGILRLCYAAQIRFLGDEMRWCWYG
jgi:hypothetical protein